MLSYEFDTHHELYQEYHLSSILFNLFINYVLNKWDEFGVST